MKLYTEEQVIEIVLKSRETGLTAEYLILANQGIELPSDEEIWNEADKEESNSKHYAFTRVARYVIDKIQGGNK